MLTGAIVSPSREVLHLLEPDRRLKGRDTTEAEFIQVLRDIEAAEGRPLDELLKTDMDRLVPIIGEALMEKFPEFGR